MSYVGYKVVTLSDKEMADFYTKRENLFDLVENEYLVIKDSNEKIVDRLCYQNNEYRQVRYKPIRSHLLGEIKPRNLEQELAFDLFDREDIHVKLIKGVYGSGKDYCMISKALEFIEKGAFQKIIYIRPNVTVKNVPDIGFLPNGVEEKLAWTLGPLFDKVGGEDGIKRLSRNNQLELVPLLFIRGRSFENSIIYVSEGQNITTEIAKLILGRIGENSQLWINADNHQTDSKIFDNDNGIIKMVDKLTGNKLFGYVYFKETLRSQAANLANLLD